MNELPTVGLQRNWMIVIFSILFLWAFFDISKICFSLPRGPDLRNSLPKFVIKFQQSHCNVTWCVRSSRHSSDSYVFKKLSPNMQNYSASEGLSFFKYLRITGWDWPLSREIPGLNFFFPAKGNYQEKKLVSISASLLTHFSS